MADEPKLQIARDPELERARAWWQEHGRPIVAGVVIGLSAVGGFNYWQYYKETRAESASVLFERLRGVIETEAEAEAEAKADAEADADATEVETETETEPEPETQTTPSIESIAEELMTDYAATPYAVHGAFALAKSAVDDGDLERAAGALEWILDHGTTGGDGLRHIARLRLAAVLLGQGQADADAVLALLEVADTAGFAARYHELSGDAHLQKGDLAGARSAYQRSMAALAPNAAERALLKLKLDNVGG